MWPFITHCSSVDSLHYVDYYVPLQNRDKIRKTKRQNEFFVMKGKDKKKFL